MRRTTSRTVAVLGLLGANLAAFAGETSSLELGAFDRVVAVFAAKCVACHGGSEPEKGLNLERGAIYRATVNVPARSDRRSLLVSPNHADDSYLYRKLLPPAAGRYRGPQMPLHKTALTGEEIARVRDWIESFPMDLWGTPPSMATSAPVRATLPADAAPQFHSTQLAHLPTADTVGAGNLEFRFLHRFRPGVTDAGSQNLWGLDGGANISLDFTYGLTDRLDLALRRTNLDQQYELAGKFALLKQSPSGAPLSLAVLASGARDTAEASAHRTHYAAGVMLTRQFGSHLSLELAPFYASRTNTQKVGDSRGTSAVGLGGLWRFNDLLGLTVEWIPQLSGVAAKYQSASIGLSIGTARHSFHLLLTNTPYAHTSQFVTGGDLDWSSGDFRLGFNITRTFGLRAGRY